MKCPNCHSEEYYRVLIIQQDTDGEYEDSAPLLANAGFCTVCYAVQEDYGD